MPSKADNVILTFPPRSISQWEKALLAEWLAATQRKGRDIAAAYVSERRGDDPMIAGRIAVVVRPNRNPAHLIYSPAESTFWVVASGQGWSEIERFRTLRAALNSIRPVLEMHEISMVAEPAETPAW